MSDRPQRRNVPLSYRGAAGRELLVLAALLLGASAALLVVARGQGTTRTVVDALPYEEYGVFDYSAALGSGVYDGDELRAPQPLFRRLGERLPLTYAYSVRSHGPDDDIEGGEGSYSLTAEVRQANGWVRTVTLVPRADFEGPAFTTAAVIDVSALAEFIRRLEQDTGYRAPQFSVRVRAHVDFEATLRGERIERVLDQTLAFTLNEFELRLDREGTEIERSERGDVQFTIAVPRTVPVPLLGTPVEVVRLPGFARIGLIAGAIVAALVGLASALDVVFGPSRPPGPSIPARYLKRVVDVDPHAQPPPGGWVRLHDLTALLRLAEQYQLPVLHATRGGQETYWVVSDSVYLFGGPPALPPLAAAEGSAPSAPRVPSSLDTGSRASGQDASKPVPAPPPPAAADAVTPALDGPREAPIPRPARTAAWFALGTPDAEAPPDQGTLGLTTRPRAGERALSRPVSNGAPPPLEAGTTVRVYWGGVWREESDEEAAAA